MVRKRNRVPVSCYPCRTRKLKCDRLSPCSNCVKREGAAPHSCSYATSANRNKKGVSSEDQSPDDMQNRIDRLEGLVLSLMHNGGAVDAASAEAAGRAKSTSQSQTGSSVSQVKSDKSREAAMAEAERSDDEDGLVSSLGVLKVDEDKGKSMYFGNESWHIMLADIAEVKNYFANHKKELESSYERVRSSKPQTAQEGPTLLLGATPTTETELRSELPPKSSVLTLCSRYFNSMDNAVNIIHGPTFQQQLRTHWQDPLKTPIMWLALLYSVLTLAMLSYHKVGDEPPEWKGKTLEMACDFRLKTVQALILADYTKPVEYTVEALMLYVIGEYSSRWDADLGVWMIVGIVTRAAFRMGYHRDAKWFPNIRPFQAEMRRRSWALVRMMDIIFSHQVSLPSMIHDQDCDTQLPNNLFDDEFHAGSKELPPSRPVTEPTPISYMIAKSRLGLELGRILQATGAVDKHISYDEIIRFDAKLRQIKQELPPHLKFTPLEGSHEPVALLIARFNIDCLYLKIVCQLHRKHLARARQNPRYAHSRRSAVEAALQALDHLATLNRESQADGRLRSVSWFIKSTATKDFALPSIVLIMDLHHDNMQRQSPDQKEEHEGNFLWTPEQRARMITSLETAGSIWKTLADTSMEAFKASKVLDIMLQKIKAPASGTDAPMDLMDGELLDIPSPNTLARSFMSPLDAMPNFVNTNNNVFPAQEQSTFMAMDFGLSPGAMPGYGGSDAFGGGHGNNPGSPFSMFAMGSNSGTMPDLSGNFDWNALDNNYAQMPNFSDQPLQFFNSEADDSPDSMLNSNIKDSGQA